MFTDSGAIIQAKAKKEWREEIKNQFCFVRYFRAKSTKKVIATCENGMICRGKCSDRFFLTNLPKKTELEIELVEDSDLQTVITGVTNSFGI